MKIEDFELPIDLEDVDAVEIVIRDDGKTLWVNSAQGCIVRICQIRGTIRIEDKRKSKVKTYYRKPNQK